MLSFFIFSKAYLQENNLCNHEQYYINEILFPEKVQTNDRDLDDLINKKNLILFLRDKYDLPEFERTGNHQMDIENFNRRLKIWYSKYPKMLDILQLRTYNDFVKYDASCYPLPPSYNEKTMTEAQYDSLFNEWAAHHPDLPKLMGETNEDKQKYEIETMIFKNKYYRK